MPKLIGSRDALDHPRVALVEALDARARGREARPAPGRVHRSGGSFTWLSAEISRYAAEAALTGR